MSLSTDLPSYYNSWNEFHDDLLKADLPKELEEVYWYHAFENKGIITRGSLRYHDQAKFSIRFIEQQALAELKQQQQTFDSTELGYLLLLIETSSPVMNTDPGNYLNALRVKVGELFYRARRQNQ